MCVGLCYLSKVVRKVALLISWQAIPDKANRIVCGWREGIKNCTHVMKENLYSRHKSNTKIGKQSKDYWYEISMTPTNSIRDEKGTKGHL